MKKLDLEKARFKKEVIEINNVYNLEPLIVEGDCWNDRNKLSIFKWVALWLEVADVYKIDNVNYSYREHTVNKTELLDMLTRDADENDIDHVTRLEKGLDLELQKMHKNREAEIKKELLYFKENGLIQEFVDTYINADDAKRELDVAIIKNMICSIKRKILGLPVYMHKFVIYYGAQGSGKTYFVNAVLTKLENMYIQLNDLTELDNNKMIKDIYTKYAVAIHELGKIKKIDHETFKNNIDCDFKTYRELYTHDIEPIRNNATFLGTSNKRTINLIKDETGMRRFYQINFKDLEQQRIEKIAHKFLDFNFDEIWADVDYNVNYTKGLELKLEAEAEKLINTDSIENKILIMLKPQKEDEVEFLTNEEIRDVLEIEFNKRATISKLCIKLGLQSKTVKNKRGFVVKKINNIIEI